MSLRDSFCFVQVIWCFPSHLLLLFFFPSSWAVPNCSFFTDLPRPQAPTVELLQSVDQEKKIVVLKCVASDYWPEKVVINWKGSLQSKVVTFTEQKMSNGRYTASSQIKITFSQWQKEDSHACEVVHKESHSKFLKKVSRKGEVEQYIHNHTPHSQNLCTAFPCWIWWHTLV